MKEYSTSSFTEEEWQLLLFVSGSAPKKVCRTIDKLSSHSVPYETILLYTVSAYYVHTLEHSGYLGMITNPDAFLFTKQETAELVEAIINYAKDVIKYGRAKEEDSNERNADNRTSKTVTEN